MKICSKCKKELNKGDFYKRKDGYRLWCKKCEKEYAYKWRANNKDKWNSYNKVWKKNNPDKIKDYKSRMYNIDNGKSAINKMKYTHGIGIEEYNVMHKGQEGRCAICGSRKASKFGRLYIDHCHGTGKIRGLLCRNCNAGLGMFKDDPEIIMEAATYLLNSKAKEQFDKATKESAA